LFESKLPRVELLLLSKRQWLGRSIGNPLAETG
jgi:hypothetical protein